MLYYPAEEEFTYAFTIYWHGVLLADIVYHKKYRHLVNIANAIGRNPFVICLLEGDLRYQDKEAIKSRCKTYCENQTNGSFNMRLV